MLRPFILFASGLTVNALAAPALPAVNLVVEVRVVDAAQASGRGDYTVSTRTLAQRPAEALQLQLLNGQTGAVRLGRALPVQWLQAVARGALSGASGASVSSGSSAAADRSGALAYAVTWVASGQSLTVRPQWPGGASPVTLDLQFSSITLRPMPGSTGTALPATRTQEAGTTLQLPLGVWTSFAATGAVQDAAEPGSGSSLSTLTLAERGQQRMQVRVTLP
jgi:hypothetical protein